MRVVVMGVSGSGKSSFGAALAEALSLPFADADAFHPAGNIAKMQAGIPLTDADRWPWLDALGAWLAAQPGVVACSALRRAYRDRLREAAPGLRLIYLEGAPDLIAARQAARPGHFMPASLMDSQFATLEPPGADESPLVLDVTEPLESLIARAKESL
ncbi:gluconokinase [Roseococcus suduntuyensis]|uniref:Gluconokinase n=1 Tax=Roseococcus suduntuyensis TaxID=455361 RepID=A0A840A4Y2_9PROT|nr:gluconokinase [Roseococcus suduntuyensis]MBB3897028.1 gluconokinase [Roseococcus suduntuyensis]